MDIAEQSNTQIVERVDAQTQTQTDTGTAEDLTLSQKLTPIAHHELQVESAAQPAAPPPPPPSSTTTPHTPLHKFDKDILRWKDVHFLRDFGDWFNPEKAVQPTYTRLLSSCGYYDPNSPLDPGEDHIPPLGVDLVETSEVRVLNQDGRAVGSPETNVDRGVGQWFVPESNLEDTTVVEHTATTITTIDTDIDTTSTGNTQTARSPTVTVPVGPSLDATNVGDTPDSDSDPTVLVESSMK